MRGRTSNTTSDSLDLLLDTICNTFGGVLFISLLVVILLNSTVEKVQNDLPVAEVERELSDLRRELTQSEAQLSMVADAMKQQDRISQQIVSPNLAENANRLFDKRDELVSLSTQLTSRMGNLADRQADVNLNAKKVHALTHALEVIKTEIQETNEKLEELKAKKQRPLRIPRFVPGDPSKQSIALVLRDNKLWVCSRITADGSTELDTTVVTIRYLALRAYVEVNPSAGMPMPQSMEGAASIRRGFEMINPDQFWVNLCVFEDSFDDYWIIRDLLVERGIQHSALLFSMDDKLWASGEAGSVDVLE